MQKYLILIPFFLLAGCFGGGSGSDGSPSGTVPRSAMPAGAISSNRDITQMSSEILIASGSDPIVRSAKTTYGGKTYTSYRLDDVKFFTAENLNEDEPAKKSFLRLELDRTGQINAIHMDVGGMASGRTVRSADTPTLFEGPIFEYVKNGDDEAIYRVVDTGQSMSDLNALAQTNKLTGGHWNRIDERLDIKTYGNDIDAEPETETKLQYSDFGHFNPVYKTKFREINAEILGHIRDYEEAVKNGNTAVAESIKTTYLSRTDGDDEIDSYQLGDDFIAELAKEDYQLFAGGYAIKTDGTKLDTLPVPENTSFKGKAIGRVYSSIQTGNGIDRKPYLDKYGVKYNTTNPSDTEHYLDPANPNFIRPEDAGHDIAKAYFTTNATLEIDEDGNQVLNMPFDGFYTVNVEKEVGSDAVITFTGTAPDVDPVYGEMYRLDVDMTTPPGGSNAPTVSSFNPGYYGVDNAAEAAGTVRYKEVTDFGEGNRREWEFQGAYGMKPVE